MNDYFDILFRQIFEFGSIIALILLVLFFPWGKVSRAIDAANEKAKANTPAAKAAQKVQAEQREQAVQTMVQKRGEFFAMLDADLR